MANAEDDLAPLAAVAERAAPAVAPGPHLLESALAQIRAGSEDPALEASYRHIAACASCRARLVEVSTEPEMPPVRRIGNLRRNALRNLAWAAAALAVLGLGYIFVQRSHAPERLAILQRPYAGIMGSRPAEAPVENANLELSFTAEQTLSAFALPCDKYGKVLSSPQWFVRENAARFVVVLAPRTFLPHSGAARGLIVWGSEGQVRPVADAVSAIAATNSPVLSDAALAKLVAEHGARSQWLSLEES